MLAKEFMKETGATHRQLDYWVRSGIRLTLTEKHGQGNWRDYDPSLIPAIKIMVQLSNFFDTTFPVTLLHRILENYEDGNIPLTDDTYLGWRHNDIRTDASPRRSAAVPGQWENPLWRGR